MTNGDGDGFQIIEERTIRDIYADSVRFEITVYGVTLEFGKSQPQRPGTQGNIPHTARLRVHMSPQHAKILAKILAKNMQGYEAQVGKLPIPPEVFKGLDIEEEW